VTASVWGGESYDERPFDGEEPPLVSDDSRGADSSGNAELQEGASRKLDGATFVFAQPEEMPANWGWSSGPLWTEDEALMIVGPDGVGKTSVLQQLLLARIGVRTGPLLGLPVAAARDEVVYLAMDRPAQAARSMLRMVEEDDTEILRERLKVWKGPLPVNVLLRPNVFADWLASEFPKASDIFVDSLKDLAPRLSDDDVGSRINLARQELLARGLQLVESHHQRKEQRGQGKPKTLADVYGSRWLTAGAGSVLLLWGDAGDRVIEAIHLKQPAEPFGPAAIAHDHTHGRSELEGNPSRWRPTALMERISRQLELQHEPVSRNQVETTVTGRLQWLRVAMDCLVQDGYVQEIEGPRNARLLLSIQAFREADLVPTSSREKAVTSSHLVPHFVPEENLQ
jgi:AAA domain